MPKKYKPKPELVNHITQVYRVVESDSDEEDKLDKVEHKEDGTIQRGRVNGEVEINELDD